MARPWNSTGYTYHVPREPPDILGVIDVLDALAEPLGEFARGPQVPDLP